uniref:NADH dehydrogenase subunit 2 n=1 Tax=Choreocolax polysiphoniae TaxID=282351 RepID=A0A1J0F7C1_9FLOR|nr:NADH dehydrogenase subunit 2 [Choreocolax polysiphoniae]APC24883.1 NADH dehydrogenase subunit 2 [Choreocolax polysiphoniae]
MTINVFCLNIYPLLIEIFLFIIICFCLLFSVILSNSVFYNFPLLLKSVNFFFLQTLFFSLLLLINSNPIFMIFFYDFLICDSFNFYFKFLIIVFLIIWFFIFNQINKILNFEFKVLILLSILSIFLLLQSYDLLIIYINIEFLSLTLYILTSINKNSEFSTEAGLKYFILGAFSSSLLLFGFVLLYSFTGLTNLQDLLIFFLSPALILKNNFNLIILTSLLFIFSSFLFKLGAAPFHYWLPDIYEGSATSITAFFALIPKLAILNLIIRFYLITFFDFTYNDIYIFILISICLSSFVGTLGALVQTKWKRFISFSSVNHTSFFLLNFCTFNLNNLIIYLIIYLVMTSSFFSFFSSYSQVVFFTNTNNRFLTSLKFLNFLNPILAFSFTILLFSLAGVPPLAGFFSKFFILISAISTKLFFLVFFMLILNCVSCFYYIFLIQKIYFINFENIKLPIVTNFTNSNSLILGLLISFIILNFLDFDLFFLIADLTCLSL